MTHRKAIRMSAPAAPFALGALLAVLAGPPASACDSCAAAVSIPLNTTAQVAQITLAAQQFVAAIGANGGGHSSTTNGAALASEDAAISSSERSTFNDLFVMNNSVRAEFTTNMQSTNCRLGTKNAIANAVDQVVKRIKQLDERGIIDSMMFNPGFTRDRIATGALYRLCQNGQLAPNDFGKSWFDVNQCIDDPTTAHDYLYPTTILDSPVLIPPPQATLDILNNPETSTPAAIAGLWNNLNDKQKKWVGATRYCENLVLNKIRPQTIRGDAAMSSDNMSVLSQNFSAAGLLFSAHNVCVSEKARRTAVDIALMPAGQNKTDLQRIAPKLTSFLMNMRGGDPRKFYAYTNLANYNANNPVLDAGQPKPWISEYVIERMTRDHGLSIKCANYGDSGTDSGRTANAISCAQIAMQWERREMARRANFMAAVSNVGSVPNSEAAIASTTRASFDPSNPLAPLLQPVSLDAASADGAADDGMASGPALMLETMVKEPSASGQ